MVVLCLIPFLLNLAKVDSVDCDNTILYSLRRKQNGEDKMCGQHKMKPVILLFETGPRKKAKSNNKLHLNIYSTLLNTQHERQPKHSPDVLLDCNLGLNIQFQIWSVSELEAGMLSLGIRDKA